MVSPTQLYSDEQIAAWLRGLLTVAWADGHYDAEEQDLIAELVELTELTQSVQGSSQKLAQPAEVIEPILPQQLATDLGADSKVKENFMRTAVMVAIADGTYSSPEDEVLHQFCIALGLQPKILESLRLTLDYRPTSAIAGIAPHEAAHLDPLKPVQEWLDHLDVQDPRLAHFLCKMIPPQCPFERDVRLFGRKVIHIPPMCKLNPLYEQLVGLRFRALSYLADNCQEDVSKYC
jgi:tellurite resistance protein